MTSLGGGRYRVTTEEVVTEEQLVAMGLELPPMDLPWPDGAPRVVHASERTAALRLWSDLLGGYEPRLSERIVIFLQEFGPEGVSTAIHQVAATNQNGGATAKYEQLVRVLLELRKRAGPAP